MEVEIDSRSLVSSQSPLTSGARWMNLPHPRPFVVQRSFFASFFVRSPTIASLYPLTKQACEKMAAIILASSPSKCRFYFEIYFYDDTRFVS